MTWNSSSDKDYTFNTVIRINRFFTLRFYHNLVNLLYIWWCDITFLLGVIISVYTDYLLLPSFRYFLWYDFDCVCAVAQKWKFGNNSFADNVQKSIKYPHTQQVFRNGTLNMCCAQSTKNKVHVMSSIDFTELIHVWGILIKKAYQKHTLTAYLLQAFFNLCFIKIRLWCDTTYLKQVLRGIP